MRLWPPATWSSPPAGTPRAVETAVGKSADLLVVKLDVTRLADAKAAGRAAVHRFGHIDVLVNNAGNFYAGFFEELSPDDIEKQLAANLIGPMNVTRSVLPVMRKQRSGHVITISSSAGLVGFEFVSAYAAAKFGVEGWMESLHPEVAPFGIHTTLVNPGFFRTQLISDKSMTFGSLSFPDYEERRKQQQAWWKSQGGKQTGDPAKLAKALVQVASQATPPQRWVAGADAIQLVEQKAKDLLAQAGAYRDLSSSLARRAQRAARGSARPRLLRLMIVIAAILIVSVLPATARANNSETTPTIVLVHGAWASPPGWDMVVAGLQKDGFATATPTLGLLSIAQDVAIVRAVLDGISGPKILVGHSYGGIVISNAAYGRSDVLGLVFTAAFVPEQGESIFSLGAGFHTSEGFNHWIWTVTPFASPAFIDQAFFAQFFCQHLNPY